MIGSHAAAPLIVVMGVSAAGKSTVGQEVASRLAVPFVDGDDLHPPANKKKMLSGNQLTDSDRAPWLDAVGERFAIASAKGEGLVIACSALRREYRDRVRSYAPDVMWVHLDGTPELLAARAVARTDHFMPASLLGSQLATLEPLQADERGLRVDVAQPVESIAISVMEALR
ncbi:gluconokinase [Demequina aurantiaca]|uniref:gluconokinase n=1 Tax=Demequina aurantiaca TaxID=676200 RepID=UPI003D333560